MTDHEVECALGYTPCVCGKIDGTWHPQCYRGKTRAQIAAGYKRAFANARAHLTARATQASPTEQAQSHPPAESPPPHQPA